MSLSMSNTWMGGNKLGQINCQNSTKKKNFLPFERQGDRNAPLRCLNRELRLSDPFKTSSALWFFIIYQQWLVTLYKSQPALVIAMEEGFDGADRQARGWYGAEGRQHSEHCTAVEKSQALSDMGLRWTGLALIGPSTTDQKRWLVKANISRCQMSG